MPVKLRGKKIRWNSEAILGLGGVLVAVFFVSQIPKFYYIWPWGPHTGYRSAGLSSGHYERRFPAILRDMPMIGFVLVGSGERLVIDYDLEIAEGGISFALWKWPILTNRPRSVGPRQIKSDGKGRIEFTAKSSGFYKINMHAYRLQGAVKVDWWTQSGDANSAGSD